VGRVDFQPKDLRLIPRFRPLDVPFHRTACRPPCDIGLLLGFNVVFFLGVHGFLRYDVR